MPKRDNYVLPEDITAAQIIEAMKDIGLDKRLQIFYDHYKELGYLKEYGGENNFVHEAQVTWHAYDPHYLFLRTVAKKTKAPIKREVQKLVRMTDGTGKEYIRYVARFSTVSKIGEDISHTPGQIGFWEEPVFKKVYDPVEMEWVQTVDVQKTIPHYELEWTPETVKELSKDFVEQPYCMIEDKMPGKTRKYVIDLETWCTKPRKQILDLERRKDVDSSEQSVLDLAKAIKSIGK